jgi:hypothetical protein
LEYGHAVVVQAGRQGDEAREPEDHGDGLDGQHGEVVVGGGQHHRGEDEVGQRQPGPDGAEDEERDRGGRSIEEEVVVPVAGGWRESEKVSFWFCSFLCCIYPFSSSLGGEEAECMNDLQAARVPRTMTEKRAWTARTGRRKTLRSTMMAINFVVVVVVVIVVVVTPKSVLRSQNKIKSGSWASWR